jgi:DnaK suppressor protein
VRKRRTVMNSNQLRHYRTELLELRDRLAEAVARMSETVRTDARPLGEHDRRVSETSETELVLEQDEENIRRQVIEALKRLDGGIFGLCQKCGGPIGQQRLDAMPYTSHCVQCERTVEAGE